MDDEEASTSLLVRNVAYNVTRDHLKRIMEEFGDGTYYLVFQKCLSSYIA